MRQWWPYAAVAAACAAAGFGLGPLVTRLRPAAPAPRVTWDAAADYENYRRPSRTDERWRENHGHAFSLKDREETLETEDPRWARIYAGVPRLRPQPAGCLECHAAGGAAGARGSYYESRDARSPIGCGDCHEGRSGRLGITRPAFAAFRKTGSQQEMRALACAQCHAEYYFEDGLVKHPWSRGLAVEDIEAHYDAMRYRDWEHAETGAPVIKVRHPQYELWSRGIHARSGVACADCHMPAVRRGGMRATDHRAAPAAADGPACGACHAASREEMRARAAAIQERTDRMMSRVADALVALLDDIRRNGGASAALAMQRKAQLRLDFVRADGSRGFHAPQEALRLLAEAIDYARQGQALCMRAGTAQARADAATRLWGRPHMR